MKELSIEEKAKAYDEVLDKAKKELDACGSQDCDTARQIFRLFPELSESEDEKRRKEIIYHIKNCDDTINEETEKRMLAWLENIPYTIDREKREGFHLGYKAALEKQGEKQQKTPIWKHWKDGIAGNGEGKPIYLIKYGHTYSLSSCLCFECDYIKLSELDKLMLEKQVTSYTKSDVDDAYVEGMAFAKNELEKQGKQEPTLPKWKYKKDNTPLLKDSIILNKYGCVAKSPSGAIVSDVWVLDYGELAKLPKEEIEKQGEQKPDWSIKEKLMLNDIIETTERSNIFKDNYQRELIDWLKSLKQRIGG